MKNILKILLFLASFNSFATEIVYVVDTGYVGPNLCESYQYDKKMTHNHGSKITDIILKDLHFSDICIVSYDVFDDEKNTIPITVLVDALKRISKQKPGIINLSINGLGSNKEEKKILHKLVNLGFKLNIAAGNFKLDLNKGCLSFPACYFTGKEKGVKIVGNNGTASNKNGPVNTIDTDYFHGTSESTANITNKLLKELLNE